MNGLSGFFTRKVHGDKRLQKAKRRGGRKFQETGRHR